MTPLRCTSPLVPTILIAILSLTGTPGCRKESGPTGGGKAPAGPAIKVIGTHQFGGDDRADHVTDLCLAYGNLYVGTKKGLQSVNFDPSTNKLTPNGDFKSDTASGTNYPVNRIRLDRKQLVVCTADGFTVYDGKSWSSESIGPVNDYVTYGDVPWIGRNTAVERKGAEHDWKEQKIPCFKRNPALSNRVHGLVVTQDNRLWVGSEFGVYAYYEKDRFWGPHLYGAYQDIVGGLISDEQGNSLLCGNSVNRVDLDPVTGKLLICTSTGLSIFDGKDAWTTVQGDYEVLAIEKGNRVRAPRKGNTALPSPNIHQAMMLGNVLWLATPAGLVRKDGDQVQVFDNEQGFPSSYVTAMAHDPAKKILYVGTEKGIAMLSPVDAATASGEPTK